MLSRVSDYSIPSDLSVALMLPYPPLSSRHADAPIHIHTSYVHLGFFFASFPLTEVGVKWSG